jgi:molybdenum transport protein
MIEISDEEIRRWIAEDVPYGDLTTHALGIEKLRGRIEFTAHQAMAVACCEEAARIMSVVGASPTTCTPSGTVVETGTQIVCAEGPAGRCMLGGRSLRLFLKFPGGLPRRQRPSWMRRGVSTQP